MRAVHDIKISYLTMEELLLELLDRLHGAAGHNDGVRLAHHLLELGGRVQQEKSRQIFRRLELN